MHKLKYVFQLIIILLLTSQLKSQHQELGKVNWLRDYDQALKLASQSDKLILILFQEVPGCATCRNYGDNVLSDPLMVDIIEHYFVPLTIFNNHKGEDAKILKKYGEPSWNNPVVRIVDASEKDIQKRLNGNYSKSGLISYIAQSFPKNNQAVPDFIALVEQQYSTRKSDIKSADFSMYCFWSGESHLGNLNGVLNTEPGFKNGKEVVRVNYDSSIISEEELSNYASKASCKLMTKDGRYSKDKDPQYYLKHSDYKYLALTDFQRTIVNSALKHKTDPNKYLSPTQLSYLTNLKNGKSDPSQLYDLEFDQAWEKMTNSL